MLGGEFVIGYHIMNWLLGVWALSFRIRLLHMVMCPVFHLAGALWLRVFGRFCSGFLWVLSLGLCAGRSANREA